MGTPNSVGTGCTAANGTLNPQNPYAAAGQRAHVFAAFDPMDVRTTRLRKPSRGVLGLTGNFGNDWRYSADFTAPRSS